MTLLTAFRTAAIAAVAAELLARKDAKVLGMVGAGHQSAFQLRAAAEQRDFTFVRFINHRARTVVDPFGCSTFR